MKQITTLQFSNMLAALYCVSQHYPFPFSMWRYNRVRLYSVAVNILPASYCLSCPALEDTNIKQCTVRLEWKGNISKRFVFTRCIEWVQHYDWQTEADEVHSQQWPAERCQRGLCYTGRLCAPARMKHPNYIRVDKRRQNQQSRIHFLA